MMFAGSDRRRLRKALRSCLGLLFCGLALVVTEAGRAADRSGAGAATLRQDSGRAAELSAARAAVDRRDFDDALRRYEALLAAAPDDADLLIEVARVNGFADRNVEAARLYRRVIEVAPQRRGDVLSPLAWQTLWAGDAAAAAAMFEALQTEGRDRVDALDGLGQARQALGDLTGAAAAFRAALAERPDDARLLRRLAMTDLWLDRHAEAIAALQALQARHPGDRDIGWSLANARNFSGLHRQALADFARLGGPRTVGERVDVARAYAWAGFEDLAAPLLASAADAESEWLLRWRVARELASYAFAEFSYSSDRDDLESTRLAVGAGLRPKGTDVVEVSLLRHWLDDPASSADSTVLQARYRWRLGDATGESGTVWPTVLLRAHRYADWSPVTGVGRALWIVRDGIRVEGEVGRELVETPEAVRNRVTVDVAATAGQWRPSPRLTAAAAAAGLRFDDGNRRLRLRGRADYALTMQPRWVVGLEGFAFSSSRPTGADVPGRGYWNPDAYRELRAFTAVFYERRPWDAYLRVGLGRSRERDGFGNVSTGKPNEWELAVALDAAATVRARLSVGGSGSSLGIGSGGADYWRRFAMLTLYGWF
jgi:tetratricopeptide (TPR) repeat protein